MKKLLMMLAFASVSVAGIAQDNESSVPAEKYSVATNSFWSNWFIQANGTWTAFYSNQERGKDFAQSPFKDFRRDMGFSVAIGKWFTPGLGLRTKFNGVWGKSVNTESCKDNKVDYWDLEEQILFNLSNMLCGYNENRVWNFIPYVGAGAVRNCTADVYAFGLSGGILNTFRISNRFAINLDLNYHMTADDFDGSFPERLEGKSASFADNDRVFRAEIGLTYKLGKSTWNKTPDVDAIKALSQGQIDALNAQLADAQDENAKLKNMLANQKPTTEVKTVKEIVAAPVSVFFNIGKSKIASRKDLQNVKDLIELAKENDSKIVVTGYADSKTGSASFNQRLSQKRADVVADELVKMGVNRDNIEVVAAGGVNVLSPVSYNRRATIQIK
ncbi:OmpA family protein [Xylanibacter muris]|uniref:OmpA family protein n=1 Tax=Xylanibacter muris TaxID=2736290 RepID=A0ABX2AQ21_9BACT|nr:OmpA family protein [Xylanibacter muris]NPD93073.1 OmpA family protein [Xylanibacter muris]